MSSYYKLEGDQKNAFNCFVDVNSLLLGTESPPGFPIVPPVFPMSSRTMLDNGCQNSSHENTYILLYNFEIQHMYLKKLSHHIY